MVRLLILSSLLFIITSTFLGIRSQQISEIGSKETQLIKIKNEISSLEKEIQNKNKKEKETYGILQNYDKQNYLLNKIINRYRTEEKQKTDQIALMELKINNLSREIVNLQNNYAKYVHAVYKRGKQSELAVLFDSESFTQALRRIFYLRKFSERREKDLLEFERDKGELISARVLLEKERNEKSILVAKKIDEEKILAKKTNERKIILSAIRKDKSELKSELEIKKKAEITVRNIIARLNEEKAKRDKELKEKLKKEEKLAEKKKEKEPIQKEIKISSIKSHNEIPTQKNFSSFELLRGKLNWPVNGGKIIRRFGENKNLILNTITLNYGIDIKVSSDLNVKSVSDGAISAIEWIPGYGSIIIISHSNDYRTVYSHLNEIYVQEGENVKAGQTIASVGESIEGNVLHFEIWNSRSNQNPEIWLAKK